MVGVEGGNLISSMIRAKVVSKQTSKIKRYKGHFRNSVNESAIPGNVYRFFLHLCLSF